MARARKTSPAEVLTELVAKCPWWLGVTLALVFYFTLHSAAMAPSAPFTSRPDQVAAMLEQTFWKAFSSFGQYLLPIICLVGAALSAKRRYTRKTLVWDVAAGRATNAIGRLDWQQFEILVGEGFRRHGFAVAETGGGGADGGIDLVLKKDGDQYLVQCKHWKAFRVGVSVVRELYGVMAAHGAAGGFVVTSGRFTDAAKTFASGRNIALVDGPILQELLDTARVGNDDTAVWRTSATNTIAEPVPTVAPDCPICSRTMVERTAKRGAHAGGKFWGCPGYPSCKGVRPLN